MKKILLVEDEPGIRVGILAYLQDLGYATCDAADGEQALACFREQCPDLVLCDLRLPGMDGLDLLSRIREQAPETPVIVVSGANRMSDAVEALKRGAWDYISKPIMDLEILDGALRRCLERARLMQENRAYQQHLERTNSELAEALAQLREDGAAARLLQRGLLPPARAGIGPWRFCRRIHTSSYLSGDFVDFFAIDDHRTGFYMADVSGHGAASAMVTAMLKALFERYRTSAGAALLSAPERLLDRLNQDFCRFPIDKYLTLFYGVLDAREDMLLYASAGQFPYPLLLIGEQAQALTGHEQPLGLFEEIRYRCHRQPLPRHFQLLLVSDGILELIPHDHQRGGFERLRERVVAAGADIDALGRAFHLDETASLPDDISFLTLSREAGA
ncbi:MAG TPA: response regulator [Sedimenticola sp.]|nr:response regulator [Sedimenticola sp.]